MSDHETQPGSAAGPEIILVVEDEVLIRLVISQYLRDCGFKVIEAVNADEAIQILESPDVTVDIVLSDVAMPGSMDGFGLARWVRKNKPNVDVILVGSPSGAADAAADLCESGPMLAKPYEPQIAVDRIRRLLADRKRGQK